MTSLFFFFFGMLVRQTHACNSINFVINISTHFYFRGFLLLCTKEKSYKNIWKIVIKRILFLFKAGILQKDIIYSIEGVINIMTSFSPIMTYPRPLCSL